MSHNSINRMYRSRMRFVTQSLFRPKWNGPIMHSVGLQAVGLVRSCNSSRSIATTVKLDKKSQREQLRKKKLNSKEYKQEVERFERAANEERFYKARFPILKVYFRF